MASEDNKTYSLTLSPQMILGLILTVLPVIGGSAYAGITFFNKMQDTIEAVASYKPYDDTEFKEKVKTFEIEMKAVKERQLAIAEQLVRISEKVSDTTALARETKAIAQGSATENAAQSREVQARLNALKQDVDNTAANLRIEMNTLKRATTNPLGK
jgi:hypothetical protein